MTSTKANCKRNNYWSGVTTFNYREHCDKYLENESYNLYVLNAWIGKFGMLHPNVFADQYEKRGLMERFDDDCDHFEELYWVEHCWIPTKKDVEDWKAHVSPLDVPKCV